MVTNVERSKCRNNQVAYEYHEQHMYMYKHFRY